jgi:hypothetical protein
VGDQGRKRQAKRGAAPTLVLGPDAAAVCLDDRSRDREAQAEAFFLRREERVEELGQAVRGDPMADVTHGDLDGIVQAASLHDDQSFARLQLIHRVHRIHHQIQHDLLQTHAVGGDRRERWPEVRAERDAAPPRLTSDEADDVAGDFVDVERLTLQRPLARQCANPLDNISGAANLVTNVDEVLPELRDLGGSGFAGKPAKGGAGVVENGRERLVDLAGDRRDQLADEREAGGMGEVQARRPQLVLRVCAR